MADFMGDSFEKVVGVAFDRSMEKVFPKEVGKRTEPQGLVGAIASGDVMSFKTELLNALEEEIGSMTGALGLMHTNITNDQDFGSKILEALSHQYPHVKTTSLNATQESIVEHMAKEMLDNSFDTVRKAYAAKARYYANNPGVLNLAITKRHFELVIWALYLLDQDYKFQPGSVGDIPRVIVIKGKDGLRLNHILIDYLVDVLQVVGVGMTDAQYHARPTSLGLAGETDPLIEPEDLQAILDWAKGASTSYAGGVDYTPRTIGTVRDAASIFG